MNKSYETTPEKDCFWMPGEFEPHEKCWMLWPERQDTWRLDAEPAQKSFTLVALAISQFEPVVMGVSPKQLENAKKILPADIHIVEIASDDSWMRDVGPTFVKHANGEIRGVDWVFNAWGGLEGGLGSSPRCGSHAHAGGNTIPCSRGNERETPTTSAVINAKTAEVFYH